MAEKFKFAEGVIDLSFDNSKVEKNLATMESLLGRVALSGQNVASVLGSFPTSFGGVQSLLDKLGGTSLVGMAAGPLAAGAAVSAIATAWDAVTGATRRSEEAAASYERAVKAAADAAHANAKVNQGFLGDDKHDRLEAMKKQAGLTSRFDDRLIESEDAIQKAQEALTKAQRLRSKEGIVEWAKEHGQALVGGLTFEQEKQNAIKEAEHQLNVARDNRNNVAGRRDEDLAKQREKMQNEMQMQQRAALDKWEKGEFELQEKQKARDQKREDDERHNRLGHMFMDERDRVLAGVRNSGDLELSKFRSWRGGVENLNGAIQDSINKGVADEANKRLDEANKLLEQIRKATENNGIKIEKIDVRARAN